MSDAEQKLPDDHPMVIAWEAYKKTEEYRNSFRWAAEEQHRSGSMWAAFIEGWQAGRRETLS